MALSHPPELSQGASHRLSLDLAYDGTLFHGWATQPGLRTVEGEISEVLSMIARRPVTLTVAGRTDAGVHASAQTAHADLPQNLWESALRARSSTSAQSAVPSHSPRGSFQHRPRQFTPSQSKQGRG